MRFLFLAVLLCHSIIFCSAQNGQSIPDFVRERVMSEITPTKCDANEPFYPTLDCWFEAKTLDWEKLRPSAETKAWFVRNFGIPTGVTMCLMPGLYLKNRIMQGLPIELRNMFNGTLPMCATVVPAAAINGMCNDYFSKYAKYANFYGGNIALALASGWISGVSTNAFELLCQNRQNGHKISTIYRTAGWRNIVFTGALATGVREGGYGATWSKFAPMLSNYQEPCISNPYVRNLISASLLGFPVGVFTAPIDRVRALQHAAAMTSPNNIPSALSLLKDMYVKRTLLQGAGTRGVVCTGAVFLMTSARERYENRSN